MSFSLAEGLVEDRFLDMLNDDVAQEQVLLRLRATSKSWRDFCRPRLLADCATRIRSEDPSARLVAMCILCTAGGGEANGRVITVEEARAAVTQGLGDKGDPDMRRLAIRTLAHLAESDDEEALYCITSHLQSDPAWPVRWAAVDALVHFVGGGNLWTREVTDLLAARLEDKDWPVRHAAVGALPKVAPPAEVIPHITPMLRDEEEDVRVAVVRILSQLAVPGDRQTTTACLERTTDHAPAVRRAAAVALGHLATQRDTSVVTALRGLLKDKSESVREAAQAVLDKLGQ